MILLTRKQYYRVSQYWKPWLRLDMSGNLLISLMRTALDHHRTLIRGTVAQYGPPVICARNTETLERGQSVILLCTIHHQTEEEGRTVACRCGNVRHGEREMELAGPTRKGASMQRRLGFVAPPSGLCHGRTSRSTIPLKWNWKEDEHWVCRTMSRRPRVWHRLSEGNRRRKRSTSYVEAALDSSTTSGQRRRPVPRCSVRRDTYLVATPTFVHKNAWWCNFTGSPQEYC
jgi:hypothetical protein